MILVVVMMINDDGDDVVVLSNDSYIDDISDCDDSNDDVYADGCG